MHLAHFSKFPVIILFNADIVLYYEASEDPFKLVLSPFDTTSLFLLVYFLSGTVSHPKLMLWILFAKMESSLQTS